MKKETLSTLEKEVPKINLGLEEKYKEEDKNKTEPLNRLSVAAPSKNLIAPTT